MTHEDLNIAGGDQVTRPLECSTAFVMVVMMYSPSALQEKKVVVVVVVVRCEGSHIFQSESYDVNLKSCYMTYPSSHLGTLHPYQ